MSKLKLLHGISRIRRAKLQTSIDQTVADDVELLAEWSNNETQYVVNELLRFALAQEEDFQKYKATVASNGPRSKGNAKPLPLSSMSGIDAEPTPNQHSNLTAARA